MLQTTAPTYRCDPTKYLIECQHHCEPLFIYCTNSFEDKGEDDILLALPRSRKSSALRACSALWRGLFCKRIRPSSALLNIKALFQSLLATQLRQSRLQTLISLLFCQYEPKICENVYGERKFQESKLLLIYCSNTLFK